MVNIYEAIAVDTVFQGQGVGQGLSREIIDLAKEKRFKKIIIGTGDAGIKQLYLYQKVGFEIFEIKHKFFIDNYPESASGIALFPPHEQPCPPCRPTPPARQVHRLDLRSLGP
ncbi:MAG: GNAT family N-acetyltransferase [Thiohalocapsa sp. PB-PSB1]|nr:MAG: GNAT family N-acetyltransferase [Thiohalocapsa sp. PB-PSB1]